MIALGIKRGPNGIGKCKKRGSIADVPHRPSSNMGVPHPPQGCGVKWTWVILDLGLSHTMSYVSLCFVMTPTVICNYKGNAEVYF